jgi:hypothetical protein
MDSKKGYVLKLMLWSQFINKKQPQVVGRGMVTLGYRF